MKYNNKLYQLAKLNDQYNFLEIRVRTKKEARLMPSLS